MSENAVCHSNFDREFPSTPPSIDWNDSKTACAHLSSVQLLLGYALFSLLSFPRLVAVSTRLLNFALKIRFPIKGAIKWTVFKRFCGGETIASCSPVRDQLANFQIASILDFAVESKETDIDFRRSYDEILLTIAAASGQFLSFAVFKLTAIADTAILEKITAGHKLSSCESAAWDLCKKRADHLLNASQQNQVRLLIDAEESWLQGAIDDLAEMLMSLYNRNEVVLYHTVQVYRCDRLAYLEGLINQATSAGYKLGIKLVRGAYMEKERTRAKQCSNLSPIHATKQDTDRDYQAALELCLKNQEVVSLIAGTHNLASTEFLAQKVYHRRKQKTLPVIFSQLYGMGDHLSFNLSMHGYLVCKYLPYGPVSEAMPYLIRRAEENTSITAQAGGDLDTIKKELARRVRMLF